MDGRSSPTSSAGLSPGRTRTSRTPRTSHSPNIRSQTPHRHSRNQSHSYSQNQPQQQQRDIRPTRSRGTPQQQPQAQAQPEQPRGRLHRSHRDRDDRPRPSTSNDPRATSVPPQQTAPPWPFTAGPIPQAPRQRRPSLSHDNRHPPPAQSQVQATGYASDPSYRRERRDSSSARDGGRDRDFYNDPVRAHLRQVASTTMDAVSKGYVDVPVPVPSGSQPMVLRHKIIRYLEQTKKYTLLYNEGVPELVGWRKVPKSIRSAAKKNVGGAKVEIAPMTTLQGARYIAENLPGNTPHNSVSFNNVTSPTTSVSGVTPVQKIGILNFASATKPGGGFLNGARAQEESIARSSSLYLSLTTPTARPFYDIHKQIERDAERASTSRDNNFKGQLKGMYTHMMIYSPSVVLFKDDEGQWTKPLCVEVVTSPAVNAGEVRKAFVARAAANPSAPAVSQQEIESLILSVMQERMARILALFEANSIRHVVLGSFGTGVFQNDVESIAGIWREFLMGSQARFKDSFDSVVFAIPDVGTVGKFGKGFGLK